MKRRQAQDRVMQGLLKQTEKILKAKSHDYSSENNLFSAFQFVGLILNWAIDAGVCGTPLVFLTFISAKLARLIEIFGSGKVPKNETVTDTCIDGANYFLLLAGYLLSGDVSDAVLEAQEILADD